MQDILVEVETRKEPAPSLGDQITHLRAAAAAILDAPDNRRSEEGIRSERAGRGPRIIIVICRTLSAFLISYFFSLCMLNKPSTTEPHAQPFKKLFILQQNFFKIAQACFELWIFLCRPPN